MNKRNPIISLTILIMIVITVGCNTKDAAKKKFIESCTSELLKNEIYQSLDSETIIQNYCNCSADKLLNKYSITEVLKLGKQVEAGDQIATQKMIVEVSPCIEELQRKSQKYNDD